MTKYRFEIHGSTDVIVEADSRDQARMQVIHELENGDFDSALTGPDCYVSDGDIVED